MYNINQEVFINPFFGGIISLDLFFTCIIDCTYYNLT